MRQATWLKLSLCTCILTSAPWQPLSNTGLKVITNTLMIPVIKVYRLHLMITPPPPHTHRLTVLWLPALSYTLWIPSILMCLYSSHVAAAFSKSAAELKIVPFLTGDDVCVCVWVWTREHLFAVLQVLDLSMWPCRSHYQRDCCLQTLIYHC